MQKQLFNNKQQKLVAQDMDIRDISVLAIAKEAVSSTPAGSNDIDFSKVSIKIVLGQAGEVHTLYSGDLKPLLLNSMFHNRDIFEQIKGDNNKTLLTDGTSHILPTEIDLGTTYNLRGSDYISVELTSNAVFSGDAHLLDSYVMVELIPTIGTQTSVVLYNRYVMDTEQPKFDQLLGDNVVSIRVLDMEVVSAYADADKRFTDFRIMGDDIDFTLNPEQVLSHNILNQGLDNTSSYVRGYSQDIYNGSELDNCSIEFDKDLTKIVGNRTHIFYTQTYSNTQILANAEAIVSSRNATRMATLGQNPIANRG